MSTATGLLQTAPPRAAQTAGGRPLIIPLMGRAPDANQLEALRRLDQALDNLERLVLKCANDKKVTEGDEELYDKLIAEAQVLYGRLRGLIGVGVMEAAGRHFDMFQSILAQSSVSSLLVPYSTVDIWYGHLKGAQSLVRQAIGRAEEMERQGRLGLSPEVVSRWRPVIKFLEAIRAAWLWLLSRPRFVTPVLERIEGSAVYRVARIATTFAAFVAYLAVVIGGVALVLTLH